jgi:RNA polymerase sigma-70 factor (ECF subfamily)
MQKADARRVRALVDEHWQRTARVLRHLGVREADLDDALQQVFIVAANRLADIQAGSERAFLARTAVNMAARVRRAHGRSRELAVEADAVDAAPGPDERIDRARALRWLDEILDAMDPTIRSVFVLYELEELTMAEIATALDLPPGTVASRLRRAREEFKDRARRLQLARTATGGAR